MDAVWEDWQSAPVRPGIRAMLTYLEKMSRDPDGLSASDLLPLREAGLSDQAIEDAIYVSTAFHVIIRTADAFEFYVPDQASFDAAAPGMLTRGYKG